MKRHSRNFIRVVNERMSPRAACEVGVWKGGNSECLLESFPELNLLMVDLYREHKEGSKTLSNKTDTEMLDALREAAGRTQFAANRRVLLITDSETASGFIGNRTLDFVFIDADHSYDGVTVDLSCWMPKVKSGGIIGGHDYGGMGDRRGRFGVKRAVDEFARDRGIDVNVESGLIWWFGRK